MPTVVVRHDLPIAAALRGRRDDLTVIAADGPEEVLAALPSAEMFAVNPKSWEPEYLDALGEGDWLQSTSAGYDAYPVEAFRERGVVFTNAAGNYGPVVAEHAFAMAFAFSRGLREFSAMQADREWDRSVGLSISDWVGKTLTVLGVGNIGECVASRGLAFDMEVHGVKRRPDGYDGSIDPANVVGPDRLDDLLPETDLLVAAVPLTEETRGMIGARVLSALPDSAVVVNVARGPVVDESALIDALRGGEIAAAGLDVFETEPLPEDSPLWGRDDVLVTPHIGGRSDSFGERFADLFLDNYDRRRDGRELRNRIV